MESRRKFLKKLGLGSLVVAAAVSPIIAHAVTKGQELNFDNPEQLMNQKITVYRFKGDFYVGKAFRTKGEAELNSLFQITGKNTKDWKIYGGEVAMAVSSLAYGLAEKFDVKTWETEKVGPYVKNMIGNIIEQEITLKQYLLELEDGIDGYIKN